MSVADHAKVAEWFGVTQSHAFAVDVVLDAGGVYRAEIQTSTPPMAQAVRPGQPVPLISSDEPEVVRCDNLDALRELTKQRIAVRFGDILNFRERPI